MWETPRESYVSMDEEKLSGGGPAVALALRFMSKVIWLVEVADVASQREP